MAAKDNPFDFEGKSKGLSEARLLVEPESYSLTPSRRDRSMPHIRLQSFKRNSCAPRSIIHRQSRRPTECDCASLTMRGASRMTGIYSVTCIVDASEQCRQSTGKILAKD